jgi:hypothetical protein
MDKSHNGAKAAGKTETRGLAHYQAEWESIHNNMVRQIKEIKGKVFHVPVLDHSMLTVGGIEKEALEAELAKQPLHQPRK